MTVKLNTGGFDYAKELIDEGKFVHDARDAWSEDKPSTGEENKFIEAHGFQAYGKWHLAIDDSEPEDTKARYKFPYGDFQRVHRCALLAAETRAGQYKHQDIEDAALRLREMIDQAKGKAAGA